MSASQPASEKAREPSRQSASCVFPMAAAPASKNTHTRGSILYYRRCGDSRGIQATGSCSCTARSRTLWAPWLEAGGELLGGKSPRWYHAARLSSGRLKDVGGGMSPSLLSLSESPFFLSPGSLRYIYLTPFVSHLISPSFICSPLPPSQLLTLLLSVCETLHALALSLFLTRHTPTRLISLSLALR